MIVLLGEVGGVEEYDVCQAIKEGTLTKPLVAWCIGTCACELSRLLSQPPIIYRQMWHNHPIKDRLG